MTGSTDIKKSSQLLGLTFYNRAVSWKVAND